MLQCFLRRAPAGDARPTEMLGRLKFSFLPGLVESSLAGTTPDFGAGGGAAYGMITALSSKTHREAAARAVQASPRHV